MQPDPRVLEAYRQALLTEMDADILRRTREKVQVITRSMKPEEEAAYFASPSFEKAMNQTRKKDRKYQAVLSGELPESCQTDLDRLYPLLAAALRFGDPIDLAFLRSLQRQHLPLGRVREALLYLDGGRAAAFLAKNRGRFVMELDARVVQDLGTCDVAPLLGSDPGGDLLSDLMQGCLRGGIDAGAVARALKPDTLSHYLETKLCQDCRGLSRILTLRMGDGLPVRSRMEEILRGEESLLLAQLGRRFSVRRIRSLLRENPTLRALQKQADDASSARRHLQEALIRAVPASFADLYPMARRMQRRFVLHLGPTNSGKTWESMQRLHAARCGIYLGPLRLLAFEQFETLNLEDVPCSLVTGEEQILVPQSRVQASTIEMADLHARYDIAVIDECQMIADRDRGGAWSAALLGLLADEIHVCASPDAENLLLALIRDCGDTCSVVRHERMAPLVVEEGGFQFPASVRPGDALIVFSKARVHALSAELRQMGYRVSLIYGALPPDVRRNQAERFRTGETDIVVSTDAIAMGMNLPIARVVFMEMEKYDGDITRPLTDSEIRQIAGRAGRFGQYDIGYVNAYGFRQVVSNALSRPPLPLTHAVIRFPESLLGLPLPLSEIINRWISMKDRSYFSKASTARMAGLAYRLESKQTDKMLLYDFLCIPFDETDTLLLSEWKAMYHAEATHTHFDVMSSLPDFQDPEQCHVGMLDGLEEDYKLCDLYYNYARRFLDHPDAILQAIQLRKDLISSGIIHILSTQKLPMRTCRTCGRHLPWNWPYAQCDHCHRSYAQS